MHGVVMVGYGGPDVLSYQELADPVAGPDEALVRVDAAVVNHLDLDLRQGTSRIPLELPHVLGLEGAGRVVQLPPDWEGELSVGDRVLVREEIACGVCLDCTTGHPNRCEHSAWTGVGRQGCYAELIATPARALIKLPESRSAAEWACVQGAFGTAWHMLVTRGSVRPGEWVLINAVGSGIGSAALQVAQLAGATVIASAGSDEKLETARGMGAAAVINYTRESLYDGVMEATDGRGVDLVYDHVGGDVFVQSVRSTRVGGRIATCGAHAGEVVDLDIIELFRAERTIIGSRACTPEEIAVVVDLVGAGRLNPVIDTAMPLAAAAEAHEKIARRDHFGKVVLLPGDEPA